MASDVKEYWEWLKKRPNLMMAIGVPMMIFGGVYIGPAAWISAQEPVSIMWPIFGQFICWPGCGLFIYGLILSGKREESDATVVIVNSGKD
ncbi:hypothetical protein OAJ94_03950 [Deltaproteobacteria bacterium]|nr:hypothetical protein [Deltaproteobacteria bacterium]